MLLRCTLPKVILSFPCSWACCQPSHTHPRSMVASPLRKPPPVVTQSSQIQFMTLKHVTKSNVHLSCLQKPVSACWSPLAGLAGVVGCDEEGKRGGQGCGTPVLASLCNGGRLGEAGRSGSQQPHLIRVWGWKDHEKGSGAVLLSFPIYQVSGSFSVPQ